MTSQLFHVDQPEEYRKAGPTDLIELRPVPGGNPLFLLKWVVETLVYGIVRHEFVHLSGPTGSAKSSSYHETGREKNLSFDTAAGRATGASPGLLQSGHHPRAGPLVASEKAVWPAATS